MTDYIDTLLVNGNDVRLLPGIKIIGHMELWAPGEVRGDDDVIPGRDGESGHQLPRAKYILHVPIRVLGSTRGERNDNLRALGPSLRGTNGGLVDLARRVATAAAPGYAYHTAHGRFVTGLSMSLLNPYTGDTELQFYNLDGAWWDGANATWLVP